MPLKTFDDYISEYKIITIDTQEFRNAYLEMINNNYDIVKFKNSITILPGDTMILTRDYIANIYSEEPIYYVIDNTEFLINDNTRLFTFLTSLKPINLRNKTKKSQTINFDRYLVKPGILENIIHFVIHENNVNYVYGEVHIDE